mmetsp:Transcript_48113/g.118023  ORF Transcript_48113/g.118023 Transcript_48113/m.118023 type:complete len:240 (+) Transcript_48113:30-749(+)
MAGWTTRSFLGDKAARGPSTPVVGYAGHRPTNEAVYTAGCSFRDDYRLHRSGRPSVRIETTEGLSWRSKTRIGAGCTSEMIFAPGVISDNVHGVSRLQAADVSSHRRSLPEWENNHPLFHSRQRSPLRTILPSPRPPAEARHPAGFPSRDYLTAMASEHGHKLLQGPDAPRQRPWLERDISFQPAEVSDSYVDPSKAAEKYGRGGVSLHAPRADKERVELHKHCTRGATGPNAPSLGLF